MTNFHFNRARNSEPKLAFSKCRAAGVWFWSLSIIASVFLTSCNSDSTSTTERSKAALKSRVTGPNAMDVFVSDTTHCSSSPYANEPCVSVTICEPGAPSNCVVVDNILLDTGSYGLRIFSSLLTTLNLPAVTVAALPIVECAQFASGADWGPVVTANVVLAQESAVTIPIQLIDSNYSGIPAGCSALGPDIDPATARFNGILGVGLKIYDCDDCISSNSLGVYYTCSGSTCNEAPVPLNKQVMNPVAALSTNNNGLILTFAEVGAAGAGSAEGQVVFGVGTTSNNTVDTGTFSYRANNSANFSATLNNTSLGTTRSFNAHAFLDSGSNGIFFPTASNTPGCSTAIGFFCPTSILGFTGTVSDVLGGATSNVSFQLYNAETQFSSGNRVFNNVGGNISSYLDYGLPFFFGRTVYIVFENKPSSLGTGPLWGL